VVTVVSAYLHHSVMNYNIGCAFEKQRFPPTIAYL
jgi:hypothetical protein